MLMSKSLCCVTSAGAFTSTTIVVKYCYLNTIGLLLVRLLPSKCEFLQRKYGSLPSGRRRLRSKIDINRVEG